MLRAPSLMKEKEEEKEEKKDKSMRPSNWQCLFQQSSQTKDNYISWA